MDWTPDLTLSNYNCTQNSFLTLLLFVYILYFAQKMYYLYNICCFLLSAIPVFAGHVRLCLSLTKIFVIFTWSERDVQIGVNILWFNNVSASLWGLERRVDAVLPFCLYGWMSGWKHDANNCCATFSELLVGFQWQFHRKMTTKTTVCTSLAIIYWLGPSTVTAPPFFAKQWW